MLQYKVNQQVLPLSRSRWLAEMLFAEASKSASSLRVVEGKKTMLSIVCISSNCTWHWTKSPLNSLCVSLSPLSVSVGAEWGLHVNSASGNVRWNISSTQPQIRNQHASPNFGPLLITKFSKQFTPERASCSFSCVTHLCKT